MLFDFGHIILKFLKCPRHESQATRGIGGGDVLVIELKLVLVMALLTKIQWVQLIGEEKDSTGESIRLPRTKALLEIFDGSRGVRIMAKH